MNTPDESAERVLEGVLGQKKMTFAEFRAALYNEHPAYLTDEVIHDLFVRHVVRDQAIPLSTAEEVTEFLAQAIPESTTIFEPSGPITEAEFFRNRRPLIFQDESGSMSSPEERQILQRLGFEKGPSNPGARFDGKRFRDDKGNPILPGGLEAHMRGQQPQSKPLGDVTLGEVAEKVASKARAALKILRGK